MLGFNGFKTCSRGRGCLKSGPFRSFLILDAVLCALKCIFVLIDNLLWHISTIFLLIWQHCFEPDTSSLLLLCGLTSFLFILTFLPFTVYFVLPPRHISKYITVLINKFIFKVKPVVQSCVVFLILGMEDTPETGSRMPQWDGEVGCV